MRGTCFSIFGLANDRFEFKLRLVTVSQFEALINPSSPIENVAFSAAQLPGAY